MDAFAKAGFDKGPGGPLNWSSTATFVDYDGDGFLDLMATHFKAARGSQVLPVGRERRRLRKTKKERDYCRAAYLCRPTRDPVA